MSKRDELLALLKNDSFGLLKSELRKVGLSPEESTLVSSFEEIQNFVDENHREPESNIAKINEFQLYARLKAIRSDARKIIALKKFDFGGLLRGEEIKEITMENVLSHDPFGLLDVDDDEGIHNLKHVRPVERIRPEYLARRTVCADFANYNEMFKVLHGELASKKRRLVKYKVSDLAVGGFYVLSGILLYLKSMDGKVDTNQFESGERDRFDGRTVCIFDNGTQSDMLFRSLDKAMLLDGYSISEIVDSRSENSRVADDITNGYIYVLRSRNARVKDIRDLHKIGHTTGLVPARIKNAKQEATYLFDDVDVVSVFRCLNIGSFDLERTTHDFLASVRLDIELVDNEGKAYRPKEWFRVNLNVIEDTIRLIVEKKITDYVYDDRIQQVVKK